MSFITSEVGKSRAWVRLAINQSQLCSYLSVLGGDSRTLKDYYKTSAFLRDSECCDIMLRVLQSVASISFNLATNAAVLNTWTQTPLVLAGIWTPMTALQGSHIDPVMAATDVASTVADDETRGIDVPESDNPISDVMFQLIIGGTPETSFISDHVSKDDCTGDINVDTDAKDLEKENCEAAAIESQIVSEEDNNEQLEKLLVEQLKEYSLEDNKFEESGEKKSLHADTSKSFDSETSKRYTADSATDNESLSRSISLIHDAQEYKDLFSAFETSSNILPVVPSFLTSATTEIEPTVSEEPVNEVSLV